MPPGAQDVRTRLSRGRVLQAAVALADEAGIQALSMRKLGEQLGVEAMSLYKHVTNKDDLIDAMVDSVFAEVELARDEPSWRIADARPGRLRTHRAQASPLGGAADAVTDQPRTQHTEPSRRPHRHPVRGRASPSVLTAHALSVIDAYVYGFAMQEKALPFDTEERSTEVIEHILAAMPADQWPHLVEFSRQHVLKPGYDYGQEFEWGLDLVLDGLETSRRRGL